MRNEHYAYVYLVILNPVQNQNYDMKTHYASHRPCGRDWRRLFNCLEIQSKSSVTAYSN